MTSDNSKPWNLSNPHFQDGKSFSQVREEARAASKRTIDMLEDQLRDLSRSRRFLLSELRGDTSQWSDRTLDKAHEELEEIESEIAQLKRHIRTERCYDQER